MNQYAPTEYQQAATARSWTPRDILTMLFRRRAILLGIALPIIVIAVYGTLTTVDSYFAESQVLLETKNPEDPTFRNLGVDYSMMMATAAQVASSIPVAERAALALMDSLPALRTVDHELANIQTPLELENFLLKGVNCGQVGESKVLSIGFSSRAPRWSLAAAGALTRAYIEYNTASKSNPGAFDYYTEQIGKVLAEVDTLLSRRSAIFAAGGLSAFKQNNTTGINLMREMEYNYLKAKADRKALESRLQEIRRAVARDEDFAPIIQGTSANNMSGALANLNDAKLKLAQLGLSYNDSSVQVSRQREYVDQARRIFVSERGNYIANLEQELAQLRAKEQENLTAYLGYKQQILEYPELESRIETIDIRIASLRDLLETLETKRGEVRVKENSDLRISNIILLNRPALKASIGGGKKLLYLVLASLIAVSLGVVAALFVDVNDHRIYDGREAQNYLNLPVLGAISDAESAVKRS